MEPSLIKLGFTRDEARCYTTLVEKGAMTPKVIAFSLGVFPNAVYRLLARLKRKGFVVQLDSRPQRFQAVPPQIAIEAYTKNKMKTLQTLTTYSIEVLNKTAYNEHTKIEFITGRNAMFAKAVELINQAKKELFIESIGEPVPDEIKIAQVKAIERGVRVQFIVHKHDEENKMLLRSWIKMGLELRYYPASGYHITIVDNAICMLSSSNPENPSDRSSVVMYSRPMAKAMAVFFENTWEKAAPIDLD